MGGEKESSQALANLLFPKIFHTFRIAIYRNNLIIAFMAIAVICLAGWIMDFSNTVVAVKDSKGEVVETELQVYMTNPDSVEAYRKRAGENADHTGVFSTLWHFASERFHSVLKCLFKFDLPGVAANIGDYFKAVGWAFRDHTTYCVIFAVIKLVVISIAGGAICRIAALQFAQDEKPGLTESLRFSINKFASFVTSPLVPLAIIVVIGFFIFLLGLIGSIPIAGELIMGIFMFLALIAGALITVVLIGAVAGFNLMFPAVAYDGSDCFDAISRSFSYVYAKPWRMGFYTIIAAVYGAICYIFVRFFAFLLLWVTHLSLQFGILGDNKKLTVLWSRPTFMNLCDPPDWAAANWSQTVAGVIVYLFLLAVVVLVVSFIISFYFSANTIIYSLMRKKVDNTPLDDVYSPFEEVDTEPTVFEQDDTEPPVTEPEPIVFEQDDTVPPATETELEEAQPEPEEAEPEPEEAEPEPEQAEPKTKKKTKRKTKKKSEPEAESDISSSEEQEN
jgi:hypothetical protein